MLAIAVGDDLPSANTRMAKAETAATTVERSSLAELGKSSRLGF